MTVREAEFDAVDRAVLLASLHESRVPRGRHGLPLSEATDPEHQYEWEVGDPITDFAQERLNAAKAAYVKRKDAGEILPDLDALMWRVKRRGDS